jgi:hypothetical protein
MHNERQKGKEKGITVGFSGAQGAKVTKHVSFL